MTRTRSLLTLAACTVISLASSRAEKSAGEFRLITLDPGHFHAALVQKSMIPGVSPVVHIYAPEGPDLALHLDRVRAFNTRADHPTSWDLKVHAGPDFLEKMLAEKPGNVVVLAGNNRDKTRYILESVKAGLHVLSDKPMAIDPEGWKMLREAYRIAEEKNLLLLDIMTERFEITTMLQKEFSRFPGVFGELDKGTPDNPAVTKESVHHFSKLVNGQPLQRPPWFFDPLQQGEAIVDVTTHLVDLVQWECFPEQVIQDSEVRMIFAKSWNTEITKDQFAKTTKVDSWPEYLRPMVGTDGILRTPANGEFTYSLRGVHAKISVLWNFEAPAGAGDTHDSLMRGTRSSLHIIIPSCVLGADAPSKKINILQIAAGRIGRSMDIPGILRQDAARLVAVCDLDSLRLADGKEMVESHYKKKNIDLKVAAYGDYREALQHPDIDAVSISTPDHWHAEPVIAAARMGKDIYVQKPLTMTLTEGRAVSDAIREKGCMFQIGSQQRSGSQFRMACEMVRSGRIGKLQTVKIGLPSDPAGGSTQEVAVPPNLNYDMWLGCTPKAPYTVDRVHAQADNINARYGPRPGWLRIEDYCLGMITGWGSHHVDIAHWGMNTELTGPVAIEAKAEFPKSGLWTVHGPYHIEMDYANGVKMIIDHTFPNGVRFEGSDGWIFVTRGAERVTASDPIPTGKAAKALQASNPDIFKTPLGKDDVRLHESPNGDHHLDWITSIQTRKPAVTSAEQAHRSTSACITGWIGMKLGRKLKWDPVKEKFEGDDAANDLLSRPERTPYGLSHMKKS